CERGGHGRGQEGRNSRDPLDRQRARRHGALDRSWGRRSDQRLSGPAARRAGGHGNSAAGGGRGSGERRKTRLITARRFATPSRRGTAAQTAMAKSPYDINLNRRAANYQPLTPLSLLERAAAVFPEHAAVIHGGHRATYATFYARARALASALARHGIARGDTVSAML